MDFDNLNRTDMVFTSIEAEEAEAAMQTLLEDFPLGCIGGSLLLDF